MPIPTQITDLSQTAASNYPSGSDSPSTLDDTQRAHASFIALLRDGKGLTNTATVASATTTDIGGQNSQFVEVTGTTTITSFGSTYNGPRYVRFTGVLTLTHNATTLNIYGGLSKTTAAGDAVIAIPNASLNGWNVYPIGGAGSGAGSDYLNTTRIDVASATTVDLTTNAPNTRNIRITGTTAITGFTVAIGQTYFITFSGALTLTNNANIVTQTGANITTAAGDTCIIRSTAANTVEVLSYSYVSIPNALLAQKPTLGTAVNTTSGTSIDFTGIPSWVKRITLTLAGVSTNGSNLVQVQLGTSGGIDSSGYLGSADSITTGGSAINSSSAFLLERSGGAGATIVRHGTIVLTLQGSNIWTEFGILGASNTGVLSYSAGSKTLSGTLDRIRLTTAGGTDTFDAGSINIMFE